MRSEQGAGWEEGARVSEMRDTVRGGQLGRTQRVDRGAKRGVVMVVEGR